VILHKNSICLYIIILETKPIHVHFELMVFQRNFNLICEILLDTKIHVVAFEFLDDGVLRIVDIEICTRVDVLDGL
jgi:hypothetical protein